MSAIKWRFERTHVLLNKKNYFQHILRYTPSNYSGNIIIFKFILTTNLKLTSLTMGHRQILASVIVNVAMVTGLKSRILGYMSIGDKVWGW